MWIDGISNGSQCSEPRERNQSGKPPWGTISTVALWCLGFGLWFGIEVGIDTREGGSVRGGKTPPSQVLE